MKILFRLLILSLSFLFIVCKTDNSKNPVSADTSKTKGIVPDEIITDGNITVSNYLKDYRLKIISIPDTVYYLYVPLNANTVKVTGEEGNWRYLINSSFFSGPRNNAKHAGWLRINGKTYEQILVDRQLTHVVSINKSFDRINFCDYKEFVSDIDNNYLEFQTGPLVIENNKLAEDYINSSINGLRTAPRTLLASLDNRQMFFVICESYTDLIRLGNYLLKLSVFMGKKLDVVNLDGGPSTALYCRHYSRINYNTDAALPFLLGVH
ncbi:MAG: phosphodiester glycosidase family protein [Bacillota bacterium]